MKYLALVTAIVNHPAANARHGAAQALARSRFHFGPAAERAIQGGQILAYRYTAEGPGDRLAGVDVYLVTAGYPVDKDEDGCDVYDDWCFAILGISRRRFFAPLRRLRAMMMAQGNGRDAAWSLVCASQAAVCRYYGYPDCYGVEALVDGVAVTATLTTIRFGVARVRASVTLELGTPPAVEAGAYRYESGGVDRTNPIALLWRGARWNFVTNPSRMARRRLGRVC